MNVTQSRIARELFRVRVSLRTLDRALQRLTPVLIADGGGHANGMLVPAARVSAKTRRVRVLQGRYMGYMRQLKPSQKAQVRKIRQAAGVRVAIRRAKELTEA
jgi:CHAD domain-containing protein